jgi:hypothetical protein
MGYLDDLAFVACSREEAFRIRAMISADLARLGWKQHPTKGQWEPVQVFEYLGLKIDFLEGRWIPEHKVQDLKELLQRPLQGKKVSLQDVAKLLGKIISLQRALSLAKLYSRESFLSLYDEGVYQHRDWMRMITLPPSALLDLRRILQVVEGGLGAPLWRFPGSGGRCDGGCFGSGLGRTSWGGNGSLPSRGGSEGGYVGVGDRKEGGSTLFALINASSREGTL